MTLECSRSTLSIAFVMSVLAALLLFTLPIAVGFPIWGLLIMGFWALTLPARFVLVAGFVLGLLQDVLQAGLLGEQAFAITVTVFGVILLKRFFHTQPLLKQSIAIVLLSSVYAVIIFVCQYSLAASPATSLYWLQIITTAIAWPVVAKGMQWLL